MTGWVVLLVLACSRPSPAPVEAGSATTATLVTTTTATSTTTTTSTPAPPPRPWPGEAPDVLLATEDGTVLLGDRRVATLEAPGGRAVDDLAGGLVLQSFPPTEHGFGRVWWLPRGSEEPVPVVELEDSAGFQSLVHQVAMIDGRPYLVVTRRFEEPEPEEYLELYQLASDPGPARRLLQTGGIEWGAESVSFAGGRFLVTEINHSCGDLYLADLSGAVVETPGLPEPPCEIHFEVPFLSGRLSPDGTLLAYVAQEFGFDEEFGYPVAVRSHLMVVRVETGEELIREQVTDGPTESVVSMDFDGEWLVWTRSADHDPAEWPGWGREVLGLHLDGARFVADVPGVGWLWLPRSPLES